MTSATDHHPKCERGACKTDCPVLIASRRPSDAQTRTDEDRTRAIQFMIACGCEPDTMMLAEQFAEARAEGRAGRTAEAQESGITLQLMRGYQAAIRGEQPTVIAGSMGLPNVEIRRQEPAAFASDAPPRTEMSAEEARLRNEIFFMRPAEVSRRLLEELLAKRRPDYDQARERAFATAEHIIRKLADAAHDDAVKAALRDAADHINAAPFTHPTQKKSDE